MDSATEVLQELAASTTAPPSFPIYLPSLIYTAHKFTEDSESLGNSCNLQALMYLCVCIVDIAYLRHFRTVQTQAGMLDTACTAFMDSSAEVNGSECLCSTPRSKWQGCPIAVQFLIIIFGAEFWVLTWLNSMLFNLPHHVLQAKQGDTERFLFHPHTSFLLHRGTQTFGYRLVSPCMWGAPLEAKLAKLT